MRSWLEFIKEYEQLYDLHSNGVHTYYLLSIRKTTQYVKICHY